LVSNQELITEAQYGGDWKGPLWVIWSNHLPKQRLPEQAAQHRVQAGLEYLQRRKVIKVLDTCKNTTRQNNFSIPFDTQFKPGLTKHMQNLSSIKSINSFINSD